MVAHESAPQTMSVDEWRVLEQTSHDIKHEYIDGHVYAMSGGSGNHSRIGINAVRELEDALVAARRVCFVYNSDMSARLSSTRYTYPDATVTYDERDQPSGELMAVQSPRLIVEVLSDTTEAYDRGKKFAFYRACAHVHTYILIATKYQAVDVYHRAPENWTLYAYGPGDTIELDSIGVRLAVDALYRLTDVPAADDPAGEV